MLKKTCLTILFLLFAFASPAEGRYTHRDFDWEGDNENEGLPGPTVESCFACHYGGMLQTLSEVTGFPRKKCEDCHTINAATGVSSGPYKYYELEKGGKNVFELRSDYRDPTIVSAHLSVRVPKAYDYSSCFSLDNASGSCHGVGYSRRVSAGGFYAYNDTGTGFPLDEPYLLSLPATNFPDTTNCLFCHLQGDGEIKKSWGDPSQVGLRHALASGLWRRFGEEVTPRDCLACHFVGTELKNFHSEGIFVERKKIPILPLVFVSILIIAVLLLVWRRLRDTSAKKSHGASK